MKGFFLTMLLSCFLSGVSAQDIPSWKIGDLQAYIAQAKNEVLVINFWATFCKPCVAEIPHFIKISKEFTNQQVKLLLVSLDMKDQYPGTIRSFAKKHGFTARMAWLNETNADYFCPKVDESWSGSIPATLMINKRTGFRKFYEGELTEKEFRQALEYVIRWKP